MNQYIGCVVCGKPANQIKRERKLNFQFQGMTCDSCYENYKMPTVDEVLGR